MYPLRLYVEAGGLISYSTDLVEIWRRAAVFVDKILKGAKPADLPIEQPTKYELVINLKTGYFARLAGELARAQAELLWQQAIQRTPTPWRAVQRAAVEGAPQGASKATTVGLG